jgi:hypothetical protein
MEFIFAAEALLPRARVATTSDIGGAINNETEILKLLMS